jgi:excisionase family DNA binding protein
MIRSSTTPQYLRPPQVAQLLGVDVHTVLGWIRAGELRAVNVAASPHGKRPRWRIAADDLAVFEGRRAAGPQVKPPQRRSDNGRITRFF